MNRDYRRLSLVAKNGPPVALWVAFFLFIWATVGADTYAGESESKSALLLVPSGELVAQPEVLKAPHPGIIRYLEYSHNGRSLASLSTRGRLCRWNLTSKRIEHCYGTESEAEDQENKAVALAFSQDDRFLSIGYSNGAVASWHIDGRPLEPSCSTQGQENKDSLGRKITALVAPKGNFSLIAVASGNRPGQRCDRLFAAPDSADDDRVTLPVRFPPLADFPSLFFDLSAVSEDGQSISIAKGEQVGIYELQTGMKKWFSQKTGSLVTALAIAASGRALGTGHLDGAVRIWDAATGTVRSLSLPKSGAPHKDRAGDAVRALLFSRDGEAVVVGTDARRLLYCNTRARTCTQQQTPAGRGALQTLSLSPDGSKVAAIGENGRIVQIALAGTGQSDELRTQIADIEALVTIHVNQGTFLTTGTSDGILRTFEGQEAQSKGSAWLQRCQAMIGDGQPITKIIAKPGSYDVAVLLAGGASVVLMDAASCKLRASLDISGEWIGKLQEAAFSSDGRWLAVGTKNGPILIWEHHGSEWRQAPRLTAHRDEISSLTFVGSGENSRLVSGSFDKQVFEWELPTGKQLYRYPALRQGPRALTSKDVDSLLAMAAGTEILLWDYKSHTQIGQPLQAKQPVRALQLVPGSTLLVASLVDGEVQTWNLATRVAQAPLNPRESGTQTSRLAVLEDGPQPIVASTAGSKVFLWNVATRQELGQLWQGGQNWAYLDRQDGKATLFRHDFGGLVWLQQDENLAPFPPPKTNAKLVVQSYQSVPSAEKDPLLLGRYTVEFLNKSSTEQASWVELLPQEYSGRNDLRDLVRIQVDGPQPNVLRMGPGESSTVRFSLYQFHGTLLPPREVKLCLSAKHYYSPARKPVGHDCAQEEYPFVAKFGPWWWQYIEALAAGLAVVAMTLTGWLLWRSYRKVTGSVVIQQLLAGTSGLRQVALYELPAIEQLLRSARFFPALNDKIKAALVNARIDPHGWQRALRATRSAPACAAATQACLAPQLRARLSTRFECDGLATFALSLPPLSLQFPQSCLLIICTSRSQTVQATVSQCSRAELGAPRFGLLLDLTRSGLPQDPKAIRAALLESHPGTNFVVLGATQATEILLSRDHQEAQEILCRAIVAQCELYQILPYHAGGHGISTEEQSLFFGRKAEMQQLLHFYKRNFLLAGPRSMGKSSLLNALAVELAHRHPEVLVVSHLLYDGNLEDKAHPWLRTETPAAFYNSVVQHPAPFIVFLYDEADEFLKEDEKADYAYCAVMRALSGDGRASFVLTGNSEVVRAVQTPEHPLSNFGILLRLEPLDQESAQQMILQPAAALGLCYSEPEQIVHWLCEQTGCRPHLLASACIAFITALFPRRDQPIELADIQQRILRAEFLEQAFERWNHATIAPLDCNVASLILKLHEPRPEDIIRHLQEDGSAVTAHELEQCLFRLYTWHYVADTNKHGRLYCPVPLFRFWLSEDRRSSLPPIAVESPESRNLTAP